MKDILVMGGTEFVSRAIAKYLISLGSLPVAEES
jgi:uncharacterized protein YbjT (DUF2867 family)